jgi:pilus assembly protein CpaB
VLATDQRIDSKDADGKTEVKTFASVTFEATPRISEKIAVAQTIGTLSLSLRSMPTIRPSWSVRSPLGEVKVPAGANPADERRMLLAIANQPVDNNTTFSTGGDVSRFQRRSVPRTPSRTIRTVHEHFRPCNVDRWGARRPGSHWTVGARCSRQYSHARSRGSPLR